MITTNIGPFILCGDCNGGNSGDFYLGFTGGLLSLRWVDTNTVQSTFQVPARADITNQDIVNWHQAGFTYALSNLVMYWDGLPVLTNLAAGPLHTAGTIGAPNFTICSRASGDMYIPPVYCADMRVYNRVLSSSEITNIYAKFPAQRGKAPIFMSKGGGQVAGPLTNLCGFYGYTVYSIFTDINGPIGITNGLSAQWNSNGVATYLRYSAVGSATYTDKPLAP
jgi:hypothetical protein